MARGRHARHRRFPWWALLAAVVAAGIICALLLPSASGPQLQLRTGTTATIAPTHTAALGSPALAQVQLRDRNARHAAHDTSLPRAATARPVVTTPAPVTPSRAAAAVPAVSSPSTSPAASTRAPAPVAAPSGSLGARLLSEAETQQGTPYVWGGAAPGGFDCSGLIYWAAMQLGTSLPRDTYSMLAAAGGGLLTTVTSPQPGDLAFFGPGHVELYVSPGVFFGAQRTGTLVGLHDYGTGYLPTVYLRVA